MQTQEKALTIEEQVRAFIADNYQYREGATTLADNDSFLAHGIIDSMGILELVTFIEERFEIRVADEDVVPTNLDSIASVSAFVKRKRAATNGEGTPHAS